MGTLAKFFADLLPSICKGNGRKRFDEKSSTSHRAQKLGSDIGRTDFLWIFIFEPPDFVAGCFFPHFRGRKCPENPPGKSPANPPKVIQQKSPTHFCRGTGPTKTRLLHCETLRVGEAAYQSPIWVPRGDRGIAAGLLRLWKRSAPTAAKW